MGVAAGEGARGNSGLRHFERSPGGGAGAYNHGLDSGCGEGAGAYDRGLDSG